MAALASASFSAHLSGGNPPHLAYSTSFIHSFIYSYAFIEHLLCVKHFAAYIDDAFPTHRAPPTHTHTFLVRPQLHLCLFFPWKIALWSVQFRHWERNKKEHF